MDTNFYINTSLALEQLKDGLVKIWIDVSSEQSRPIDFPSLTELGTGGMK